MKYTNFPKAKELVSKIDKYYEKLNEINATPIVVIQTFGARYNIFTIGTDGNCEHEYTQLTKEFIERIKADLTDRINELIAELELL
ncbi:MAG TPA: hypothetical protein VL443_24265 [Cyclobacteriaceae bacterium]|jgi:hypothetical protein|nr:hypothetical protein [Cyclobacteriaceae bacterium]